jgi:hypothetical protein
MNCSRSLQNGRLFLLAIAAFAGWGLLVPAAFAQSQNSAQQAKPKLSANELRGLIQTELARNHYYKPGYLLSRSDAANVFDALRAKGFDLSDDAESLYEEFLAENSPLVKLLKSPDGRDFMQKIAADPTAYDRLERLSWSLDGRFLIEDWINAKDGVKKFQALRTKEQLAKVSRELAEDAHTADFALPTGRIHTADQFFARLDELLNNPPAE